MRHHLRRHSSCIVRTRTGSRFRSGREGTMRIFRFAALLGLALCCAQKLTGAAASRLVLAHVTLIDATGRAPQNDQTVVIESGRIISIGPAAKTKTPKNARIV